ENPADCRASAAQDKAFGQQHATQRPRAGPEGRANRKFTFAADSARENQVGHIAASDDEDKARGSEEDKQDGARARGDLVAKHFGADGELSAGRIGLGGVFYPGGGGGWAVRAGLL